MMVQICQLSQFMFSTLSGLLVLSLSILWMHESLFLWLLVKKCNLTKEEERCMQLNAQAINSILGTLSAYVLDEVIFNGEESPESAHLT